MLVLSRKYGETICIGDDIRVTVMDIRNGKIRIGIEAPKNVKVHREEVYDLIRANDQTTKNLGEKNAA